MSRKPEFPANSSGERSPREETREAPPQGSSAAREGTERQDLQSAVQPALEPKALREEPKMDESEWKLTFDAVPHIVFVLDSENRIKHANRAAMQALGLEFSQIVGRHCYGAIHNTTEPPPYCPHQVILKSSQGGEVNWRSRG